MLEMFTELGLTEDTFGTVSSSPRSMVALYITEALIVRQTIATGCMLDSGHSHTEGRRYSQVIFAATSPILY